MARRTTPPLTRQPANLTAEQMRAAIPKLQRRIAELKSFDVASIGDTGDPRIRVLGQKIQDTLVEVFGPDSIEYHRDIGAAHLDRSTLSFGGTPLHEIQAGHRDGIDHAIAILETDISLFEEKLQDSGATSSGRAVRAFADLDLQPDIHRAASKLFQDGHYANAVESACKVLDLLVKMRSGRTDLSGTELMQVVFSPKAPVLRFSALATETDRSEQQGMMFLFAGAMLALRNPRAHELIEDDPEQALEYIAFLSMLAKALTRTEQ